MGFRDFLRRTLQELARRRAERRREREELAAHGVTTGGHRAMYRRLQGEAAVRLESTPVHTPAGSVWMSPIESRLYEAMLREGLAPIAQFCVHGYYVDFAFPGVRLAVEADGAAYHDGDVRHQRDGKRDWILGRYGWKVLRFHGSTIHHRAENCAYVVGRELRGRGG